MGDEMMVSIMLCNTQIVFHVQCVLCIVHACDIVTLLPWILPFHLVAILKVTQKMSGLGLHGGGAEASHVHSIACIALNQYKNLQF